ncbi:hypothetical protein IWX83_003277 [Flavobacterium sp. CG_9.1]|uniref:Uncharacterized protein n=1 Tax=Flavobacterium xanthum TaxID=69322 RepID=A0A1M7LX43_9FLAO|nr:hypothetical protein [Flavobacterium sp. CG_9.1]SHM82850.1 hypothetical protein SAMN05443669_10942 [Flavobacterium xanthum]
MLFYNIKMVMTKSFFYIKLFNFKKNIFNIFSAPEFYKTDTNGRISRAHIAVGVT